MLDAVDELNAREAAECLDPDVQARIAQAEMAYRMQMSVPELVDLSSEDAETLELYGPDVTKPGTFAANCLLARRLAERGVRFIQLYMRGWDQHGNLPTEIRQQSKATDQPIAALIADLRRRGLLDDTLVLWAGEFGRTVYSQGTLTADNYGRDHHPRCFTLWLAGGGIRPGITYGKTDDFSYNIVENPVEVHDMHATMLHLLGLDHERLTYRHQGRDYRLTDVFGKVIPAILA
jgi:arylsulfatase A-like enzyme